MSDINILPFFKLLRPLQWMKNLMLLFPPFLGGVIATPGVIAAGVLPLVSFCLASSAVYVFNDIHDKSNDANHPDKKHRPIPSGNVSVGTAYLLLALLLTTSLCIGFRVSTAFLAIVLTYIFLSGSYTLWLKELPIVDLFCISSGFLLRLHAGGEAYGVRVSEWLFLSVFLLAIFLSTGKRLSEKNSLGENAGSHRKSLQSYPPGLLEGIMYMTGGAVLVTYTMYVISRQAMVYTVPISCFILLRYIFRIKSGKGGDPTESLLKDGALFVSGGLWLMLVSWATYFR